MELLSNGLITLIDWCAFTIPPDAVADDSGRLVTPDDVCELLKMPGGDWVEMPRGLNGYSKQRACGDIKILYAGQANMGIHVMMTGQGCRQFETYYGELTWEQLFYRVKEVGGKFARIDLAVDDIRYNGDPPYWTVRQLVRKIKRNECRSKFKTGLRLEGLNLGTGESTGDTLYAGSPQSMIKIRIYEKDCERAKAGMMLEEDLTAWNRLELELKDDRAGAAVDWLQKGLNAGQIAVGVLAHYVDMVDKQADDDNKARWPRSKFWSEYLDAVAPLPLAPRAPDRTIDSKREWLERQMAPTLAQVMYAGGSFTLDDFVELIEQGWERMSEAQWSLADKYRNEIVKLSDAQQAELKRIRQKKKDPTLAGGSIR
jgi:phage replication initiation protein